MTYRSEINRPVRPQLFFSFHFKRKKPVKAFQQLPA